MANKGGSLAAKAKGSQGGFGCLAAFFSLFLLAGIGVGIPLVVLPVYRAVVARSWQAVPCTVESSTVQTHSGDDSDTYSVEVRYAYEYGGRHYQGDRYRFLGGSSSGYDGKAAVVAEIPPGTRAQCWVDPDDPSQSVFDRGLGWGMALFALIPLVFAGTGGAGMVWAIRRGLAERAGRRRTGAPAKARDPAAHAPSRSGVGVGGRAVAGDAAFGALLPTGSLRYADATGANAAAGRPKWLPPAAGASDGEVTANTGPVVLAPAQGPVKRFVGLCFVALFWNGIVSVFLWKVVEGWRSGSGDGCLTAFVVPFVLVGIAILSSVPHQFLALFNPRPEVTLERASVEVGGALTVSWRFTGASGRLRSFKLWVEGEEVATYRRGTDTHTDRATFATVPVVELLPPSPLGEGQASFVIPADTMHSFAGNSNQVVWKLKLAGEIARWPDVGEEFPLLVVPPGLAGRGGR
jgi:hypothetical protein